MTDCTPEVLLGFDFGLKRIGVAVGQTVTKTARPLTTLKANDGIPRWEECEKLVKMWQPTALVVGIPLNMDGTEQRLTHLAKQFANVLQERFHLPVYGMDERLSTKEARDRLFKEGGYKALQNGQIDSIAAQLILQNWLTQSQTK
ncbi:MAG TPA: Holliday junction resolvase RuvX [Gammaproteobacteria bacterium]|nr:Holliday junction resolvase RuvX [Gammaproteobacteria bacterium]